MTEPASGTIVTTTAGIAAVMTFMPFGVSLPTLVLGGFCFFAGSCARTGLALNKKLDSADAITMQYFARSVAALLLTIPLAATASCIVFLAAHVAKVDADAALGGLLLIMGVRGPEGFQWLVDTLSGIFTKFIPGNKSGGGAP